MRVRFELEIVGGPYDGTPALGYVSDFEVADDVEPPEVIWLNRCPGDGRCRTQCSRQGHVSYWVPALEDCPPGSIEYELEPESVEVCGARGSARYVLGRIGERGRDVGLTYAGATTGEFGVAGFVGDGRAVRFRLWEVV